MNKEDLKKIAIDAAMERVVGSSSVPVKYLKKLIDEMSVMIDEYKAAQKTVATYEAMLPRFLREIERIEKMQKGEKGEAGRDGRDGRDGKDAEEVDLRALAKAAASLIKVPKDGKDAEIDYDRIREEIIQDIIANERLTPDHIKGLRGEIASYRSQLAGKHYGKDTMVRGGGDTVAAGTGISITSDADGNRVINSTGGSFAIETPVGVVDAVNTTFTPSAEPVYVIADGITYFAGAGYTWDGTDITMDVPPSQYIRDAIS